MKKKIVTLLIGTAVVGTKPAFAMDEIKSETEVQGYSTAKAKVPQEIRDQIKNTAKYADRLISAGEEVYLMLGSANTEIEALQDSSKAKHWVFWNLSTHEGGKSSSALNAFIDVDFNNKDILKYASKKLKNKFTQIVIPELVLDYVKWGLPEFKLWHDMLSNSGVLTFADLNLSYITPQIQKFSNDVATIDMINSLNGFHGSYTEREEFLANTYPTHTYQRKNRPGFLTAVLPSFKSSDKALDLRDLPPADNAKVTAYVKEYLALVNDAEYKDMDTETATSKIHNKARFHFPHLRPLTMQHFFNKVPFYTEDQAREYLEREVAVEDINKKIASIFSTTRHTWLKKEFGQIFSEVRFEDNDKSDTIFNDIPSASMKRGNQLIYLKK